MEESLSLFRTIDDRPSTAMVLQRPGRLAEREGDTARAAACFAQALPLHREAGNLSGVANCSTGLAAAISRERGAGNDR